MMAKMFYTMDEAKAALGKSEEEIRAYAQPQPAIAGGAGVFIMPGQVSDRTWGCFLLDVDSQTLCAYQFKGGKTQLELIAARNYKFDRRLANFNTTPAPRAIEQILQEEQKAIRGAAPGG